MESLWSRTTQLPEFEESPEDLRVQNLVIGGGIAGILIAYLLQEKGQEVVVLEANEIASGQTKNTTAKITSQHGLIYHDMIQNTGKERALGYAAANETAIKKYEEIITKEGIACHFEKLPSFLYSVEHAGVQKLKQEAEAAKDLGLKAKYVEGENITELPFPITGAVRFEEQAQFHPLEFIQAIASKLTIYENTRVLEVDDYIITTDKGMVVADNVIFATHYPFPIVPGYYFLRQHQSRSYVLALEGEDVPKQLKGMYYGIDKNGSSLRCAEGKLLFGGSAHRTGRRIRAKRQASSIEQMMSGNGRITPGFCGLRKRAKELYPKAKEFAHWAAQDCMPHDHIPFIGRFSRQKDHWYIATGFQKWGMSTAMVAAMIISDQIVGKENPYAWVFTPQRLLLKAGIKDFGIDVYESVLGLTKGIFTKKERKCPHMGCALTWNEDEGTWDCPCHGSRFEEKGALIDNPAQTDLPIENKQ